MAKDHSFDISCKVEIQEVKNALDQTRKEIGNRYDFKGVDFEIELDEKSKKIAIVAASDYQVEAIFDTFQTKALRRELSINAFAMGALSDVGGGRRKGVVAIKDTLQVEDAKKIVKEIKDAKLKVQATIQGDTVRVVGKSLDDLQTAIAQIRAMNLELPLNYGNYR